MVDDVHGAELALHRKYRPCRIEREIFKIHRVDTKGAEKLAKKFRKPREETPPDKVDLVEAKKPREREE
jgi:hypothetical protein